ncbi:MAG: hypothetical protein NVS4B8_28730 [Herpetosiphon sp.]
MPRIAKPKLSYPATPDGRYFVVRGRLWRLSNPTLPPDHRAELVQSLMHARREVGVARRTGDQARAQEARQRVQAAKEALGERGAAWWTDGSPDYNRHLVQNTPYRTWYETLPDPN